MPLKNLRWERFCQAYVRGETAGNGQASYRAAGFRTNLRSADVSARRLLKKQTIRSRIGALQAKADAGDTAGAAPTPAPDLPLSNPRWERFCQAFVNGATAGNASMSYRAAGYAANAATARAVAHRLMKRSDVRARIDALRTAQARAEAAATAKAVERLALTKENVLAELTRIAFANMADYVRKADNGEIVPDLARLDRDKAAGIADVRVVTEVVDGGRVRVRSFRIKLANKVAALVALGKHLGLFVERQPVAEDVSQLTDDELRARLAELDRKLADARARTTMH